MSHELIKQIFLNNTSSFEEVKLYILKQKEEIHVRQEVLKEKKGRLNNWRNKKLKLQKKWWTTESYRLSISLNVYYLIKKYRERRGIVLLILNI